MHAYGLNILAIVVAAAATFLLGGPWYSAKLFGTAWNREMNRGEKTGEGHHPARVFAVSFLFALIAAFAFAWMLGPEPELGRALTMGAVAGFCFVAASFGINYQFAGRSTLAWAIDGGYHTVQFLIFGLVLGLWH
ncbi:MAG TPA: DUF1761 domain-containing protein [Gammaproteobacteria bacterium]